MTKRGPKPRPLAERLWARVANVGGPGCWEWTGYRMPSGHGQIGVAGKGPALTHRVAFEVTYGPLPAGMDACHTCDNPPCCRPDHLFAGTPTDNNRDASAKFRLHFGEADGNAKLTAVQVGQIRMRVGRGATPRELAAEFGVTESNVAAIVAGRSWRHLLQTREPERLPLFESIGGPHGLHR